MSARELGNPLGNPLGLKRKGSKNTALGDQFTVSLYRGSGKFTIPAGFTNFEIIAVGGGAPGSSTRGGGAGATAIKSGVLPGGRPYAFDYFVGLPGLQGLSGGTTTVSSPDFSISAQGGIFGESVEAIATGGDQNYPGVIGATVEGRGLNSLTGPASGSRSDRPFGNSNFPAGGGAGFGGGNGGVGGAAAQAFGGRSSAPFSFFSGTQADPSSPTAKTINSGQDGTISKGGDGGPGGGGGASVQTSGGGVPGNGGSGLLRVSYWRV